MNRTLSLLTLALVAGTALAKLPAPNDEAKAKAAEAAAKTAHGNKVADFKLCQSMDRVAVSYREAAKKAGKDVKPATETPPCADPGPYVSPASAPAAGATAAAPVAASAPVASAAAPAKK